MPRSVAVVAEKGKETEGYDVAAASAAAAVNEIVKGADECE